MKRRLVMTVISGLASLSLVSARPAAATKVFTMDWIAETSGSIADSNSFDTVLHITYLGGVAGVPDGGGAKVFLYLYDFFGVPMKSATNADVCNPCTFLMSAGTNHATANVHNLILAAGGFDSILEVGFGIITVTADNTQVALQTFVVNSHTGPLDLSMFGVIPVEIGTTQVSNRVLSFIGAPETSGTGTSPNQFDTSFLMTYAGGLGGLAPGAGATIDFYMIDRFTGLPSQGSGGDACFPCSFVLGPNTPHDSFRLQDAFIAAGGFESLIENVDVLAFISGDAHLVSITGVVQNSISAPFDVTLTNLGSMEHPYVPPPTAVGQHGGVLPPGLRGVPNPFNPSVEIEYVVLQSGPVRIDIVDVQGKRVATVAERWRDAGTHTTRWDGTNDAGAELASGVYFARMTSPSGTRTLKLTLVK